MNYAHTLAALRANEAQLDDLELKCLAVCEKILRTGELFSYAQTQWIDETHRRVTAND